MTPLTRMVSLVTLPIALLISMAYILGAEEGPGDGFTAGIISALGLTLEYLTFGYRDVRRRLGGVRFEYGLVLGFLVVLFAAGLPLLLERPFLSRVEADFHAPLVGDVALSLVMLFDLGIYLVVLSGSMIAIDRLRSEKP